MILAQIHQTVYEMIRVRNVLDRRGNLMYLSPLPVPAFSITNPPSAERPHVHAPRSRVDLTVTCAGYPLHLSHPSPPGGPLATMNSRPRRGQRNEP